MKCDKMEYMLLSTTNIVQVKCNQYWPSEGAAEYGDIEVQLEREDVLAFYTLRSAIFDTEQSFLSADKFIQPSSGLNKILP